MSINVTKKIGRLSLIVALIFLFIGPFALGQSHDDITVRIDDLMSEHVKSIEAEAALLIVRNGNILIRKGYGLADLELEVPVVLETVFAIGLMTKQFTAVAILMPVEQEKLSIMVPVPRHSTVFGLSASRIKRSSRGETKSMSRTGARLLRIHENIAGDLKEVKDKNGISYKTS